MNFILFLWAGFASIKLIHMFQLNSYRYRAQIKWYKNNFFKTIILILPLKPAKAKKPLVYTARVKRLMLTTLILLAIISYKCGGVAIILTPLVILLANLINTPIEKIIKNFYIKNAKKILKSNSNLKVIGITGSYGKTSVKFYLNTLLKAQFNCVATPESYNTPMGVVMTIREKMRATDEVFVCEMGAKSVGQIKEICDIVNPEIGIITSLGAQHLESFKSIENVIKTKYELLDALPKNGLGFVNGDNQIIREHMPKRKVVTYGINPNNDYHATDIKVSKKGTSFKLKGVEFQTSLIGEHNVVNVIGAIAVCNHLGIELEKLKPFVKKIESVPHRLQLIEHANITIIDDAYNSNPAGCEAALKTLDLFDDYKILITPGMVELGEKQEEENFAFGKNATSVCDYIILVGKKQTVPIYNGIKSTKFREEKLFVADTLQEALNKAYEIKTDKRKIVLLENDLPDNY